MSVLIMLCWASVIENVGPTGLHPCATIEWSATFPESAMPRTVRGSSTSPLSASAGPPLICSEATERPPTVTVAGYAASRPAMTS